MLFSSEVIDLVYNKIKENFLHLEFETIPGYFYQHPYNEDLKSNVYRNSFILISNKLLLSNAKSSSHHCRRYTDLVFKIYEEGKEQLYQFPNKRAELIEIDELYNQHYLLKTKREYNKNSELIFNRDKFFISEIEVLENLITSCDNENRYNEQIIPKLYEVIKNKIIREED